MCTTLLLLVAASLLISSNVYVLARDVDFCFADEKDPYLNMATKTAYHFVHDQIQTIPHCRPMQIWMVATHGTRCPTRDEIAEINGLNSLKEQIIHNHEIRGDGHMCNRDLENLRRWPKTSDYLAPERAEVLTPQGVEDMKLLARRLQSNFPELLQPNDSNITAANYKFRTAGARDSLMSFMEGLFGSRHAVSYEETSVNDALLSAYKTCALWENATSEEQSTGSTERNNFEAGSEFQNLLKNVSRRLGFKYNISIDLINAMYDACRYEKAWTVTTLSPWCAVFSKEELFVLEYREDLDYYYKASYGRDINARLGCPLLHDMMKHFWYYGENIAHDKVSDEPAGIFYFSDVVALQNLLTTMGINEDHEQLTAYNYRDMAKRKWRTSLISSFAANLVAVFYKCNDGYDRNKVMFYLAEKPVRYDNCEVGLCNWEFLRGQFSQLAHNCKLDVCWEPNKASSSLSSYVIILLTCFSLVRGLAGYQQL